MRQNLSKLSIQMLVVFEALCRYRSTSLAAEALNITQPGVSQYLKQLRETFDDPLFVRAPKGLEPTDRSLALLEEVENILNNCDRVLEKKLNSFNPKKDEYEFIVGFPTFHNKLMVHFLSFEIIKKYPNIKINLINIDFDDALGALNDRQLDLYVGEGTENLPKMYSVDLLHESQPYKVICSNKSPLFGKKKIAREQFISEPNIKISNEVGETIFDRKLKKMGLMQENLLSMPDIESAVELIKKTDYIMMYDQILIKPFITGNSIDILEPEFEMPHNQLFQVWHASKNEDPAHQWLHQYVKDNIN